MNKSESAKNHKRLLFLIPIVLFVALIVLYYVPMKQVQTGECSPSYYSVANGIGKYDFVFVSSLALFVVSITLSVVNLIVEKNKCLRILTYIVYLVAIALAIACFVLAFAYTSNLPKMRCIKE